MNYKKVTEEMRFFTENSTKCKCGHTVLITSKEGYKLCNWCHRYVFKNKELEKKYRKEEFIKTLKREI